MDFSKNENQVMIAQMVRDFAEKEIRPKMMEWDESQEFPIEVFKKLGEMGLMGVFIPEEYGGSGFSYDEYITVIDEISLYEEKGLEIQEANGQDEVSPQLFSDGEKENASSESNVEESLRSEEEEDFEIPAFLRKQKF